MSGFRRYNRKSLKYGVKIADSDLGDFVAETRDISDAGLFIRCSRLSSCISVGQTLQANVFAENDHVQNTKLVVVRTTEEGVGFAYA